MLAPALHQPVGEGQDGRSGRDLHHHLGRLRLPGPDADRWRGAHRQQPGTVLGHQHRGTAARHQHGADHEVGPADVALDGVDGGAEDWSIDGRWGRGLLSADSEDGQGQEDQKGGHAQSQELPHICREEAPLLRRRQHLTAIDGSGRRSIA